MKKTLETVGLIVLICFSFILTEKTNDVIRENDVIMTTLKEQSKYINIESIDAKIDGDEIIPGISGKQVNIEESYLSMKKIGFYHSSLLVLKEIEPSVSINEYYNKYIVSGNRNKRKVSLIFKVYSNNNLKQILNILNDKELTANFFIDGKFLENNMNVVKKIALSKNIIGNLGYSGSYTNDNNYWVDSTLKKLSSQNYNYCYLESKNDIVLDECNKNKNYTIIPSSVISDNLLSNIKKDISNGSIISIEINNNNLKELSTSIDYIKSKGLEIVTLDYLLVE